MNLLAIDPGNVQSAFVVFDGERVLEHGIVDNAKMRWLIHSSVNDFDTCAIEHIGHYGTGMSVGREVFDTCYQVGRLQEAWEWLDLGPAHMILRKTVAATICGTVRAKDSNIRQALIDKWGGKDAAIGCKKTPGPLHGVKADEWQALALGVAWFQLQTETEIQRHACQ